jgi:hypothetical protein
MNSDPSAFLPVASLYTDCAIPVTDRTGLVRRRSGLIKMPGWIERFTKDLIQDTLCPDRFGMTNLAVLV